MRWEMGSSTGPSRLSCESPSRADRAQRESGHFAGIADPRARRGECGSECPRASEQAGGWDGGGAAERRGAELRASEAWAGGHSAGWAAAQ